MVVNVPNGQDSVKTSPENGVDTPTTAVADRIGLLERLRRARRDGKSADRKTIDNDKAFEPLANGDQPRATDNHAAPASDKHDADCNGRPPADDRDAPKSPPASQSLFDDLVDNPATPRPARSTSRRSQRVNLLTKTDEPQYLCANPFLIQQASGSVAGLTLPGLWYWLSNAKDGLPRWRPQPHYDRTSCGPGYLNLADFVGLDVSSRKRAESQIKRAIDSLEADSLVESFSLVDEPPDSHVDWLTTLADQRQKFRRWFRLTAEFSDRFQEEVSSQRDKYGVVLSVKVWRADVRERDPNQAILLGQLWYHCVAPGTNLCAYKQRENWLPRSYKGLGRETGLTVDQVREAVKKLRRRGLISAETFRFKGHPVQHYRINNSAKIVIQRWRDDFRQRCFENEE